MSTLFTPDQVQGAVRTVAAAVLEHVIVPAFVELRDEIVVLAKSLLAAGTRSLEAATESFVAWLTERDVVSVQTPDGALHAVV